MGHRNLTPPKTQCVTSPFGFRLSEPIDWKIPPYSVPNRSWPEKKKCFTRALSMVMVRPSWAKTRRAASIWVKINRRPPTSSHPSARERIHHRRWGSRRDSMSRSLPVGRDLAITDGSVRKKKRGGIGLAEKSARVVNLCSRSIFPRCPNWNAEHKSRLRNDKSFERCFHNPLACPHFVRSSCVEMETNGF